MNRIVCAGIALMTGSGVSFLCAVKMQRQLYATPTSHGLPDNGSAKESECHEDLKLICAQVFFRHGARMPLQQIPYEEVVFDKRTLMNIPAHTDIPITVLNMDGGPRPPSKMDEIYQKEHFKGGCLGGQITSLGRDQMYQLGVKLKRRYIQDMKFVSHQHSSDEVYIQSTNMNRTVDSAQSVLAGMYGTSCPKEGPIIIRVNPSEKEMLYPNLRHCTRLRLLYNYVTKVQDDLIPGMEEIACMVKEETGRNVKGVELVPWKDNILARKTHDLPVTKFLQDLAVKLEPCVYDCVFFYCCGVPQNRDSVMQLTAGPAWHIVKTNIEAVTSTQDRTTPQLYLYSVHDVTLVTMLETMGVNDHKWPPYAASLLVELYQDQSRQQWVKVLYCDKEMILPNSSNRRSLIPLEQFVQVMERFILSPEQYHRVCQDVTSLDDNSKQPSNPEKSQPEDIPGNSRLV